MEVKRRLVISISIRLDDLPVGDLGVFHENVGIGDPLGIRPAHEPFDGEPMIGFMRGQACRWKRNAQAQRGEYGRKLPSVLSLPQTGARSCRSRKGFKQLNASPRAGFPSFEGEVLA